MALEPASTDAPRGSPLGDGLRALHALRPLDWWAGAAIVLRLGLRAPLGAAGSSARTTLPLLDDPAEPEPEPPALVPAQRLHLVRDNETLQPAVPAELQAQGDGAAAPPSWLQEVPLLPQPAQQPNPFRGPREPLFEPRWQRAILTRLASSVLPAGELDLHAVVAQIAAGLPLRQVPRRRIATAVKGLRVLVDQGPAMQPYQLDVADLLRAFVRTLGPTRLRVEGFRGLPSWGVQAGLDGADFRPSPPGMALVLLTDLGLPPQPVEGARAGAEGWLRFLATLRRQGQPATLVVPRPAAQLPVGLARVARMVPWDRRTLASRLAEPAGGAATVDETVDDDADAVQTLNAVAALDPATRELACAAALATRIESRLLRDLRLALAAASPLGAEIGVHTEARLWFSDLVAERASTGIALVPSAREALLRLLRRDRDALRRAWTLVEAAHADAPPALRMEELVAFHWLNNEPEAARQVLRSLVATLVAPQRSGSWRWATQAVLRLPRALLALEEAQMLALGTAARSVESVALQGLSQGSGSGWHWLRPPVAERDVIVTLRRGAIEFAPRTTAAARDQTLVLRVPDMPLVLLEISPMDKSAAATTCKLNPQRRMLVTLEGEDFEIGIVGGGRWRLRALRERATGTQRVIARNRAPRVQIEYDVELYGALKKVTLPFVVGVLADLIGTSAEPMAPVAERKFLQIDADNFDERMKALRPRLVLQVEGSGRRDDSTLMAVELVFERLEDFQPVAIAQQVPALADLLRTRSDFGFLALRLEAHADAASILKRLLQDEGLLRQIASRKEGSGAALEGVRLDGALVANLLRRGLALDTAEDSETLDRAIAALARHGPQRGDETGRWIELLVAQVDKDLSRTLDAILHHPDFQRLEAAWRGLAHLVQQSETDELLKIRVLNISKADLQRTMRRYEGTAWDQSPLYRRIVDEEFGQFGGEPYGCIVADYGFDHSPADVELLRQLGQVGAAAQLPFIAAAAPSLVQRESWAGMDGTRDLTRLTQTAEYAAWRELRESDVARFLVLAVPGFLARLPYDSSTQEFGFDEDVADSDPQHFVWANAAYAMAANLTRSFKATGWFAQIRGVESGGAVDGMLSWKRQAVGSKFTPVVGPVELHLDDRGEASLSSIGLLPLVPLRGGSGAAFFGASTLMRPTEHEDADTNANAILATRLNVLLPVWRLTHYLRCMVRDHIGSFSDRAGIERYLQSWLMNYVDGDPANSSDAVRAARPLAAAEVAVEEGAGDGYFEAKVYLRPHFQTEGLTVSLRTSFRLPNASPAHLNP